MLDKSCEPAQQKRRTKSRYRSLWSTIKTWPAVIAGLPGEPDESAGIGFYFSTFVNNNQTVIVDGQHDVPPTVAFCAVRFA